MQSFIHTTHTQLRIVGNGNVNSFNNSFANLTAVGSFSVSGSPNAGTTVGSGGAFAALATVGGVYLAQPFSPATAIYVGDAQVSSSTQTSTLSNAVQVHLISPTWHDSRVAELISYHVHVPVENEYA